MISDSFFLFIYFYYDFGCIFIMIFNIIAEVWATLNVKRLFWITADLAARMTLTRKDKPQENWEEEGESWMKSKCE